MTLPVRARLSRRLLPWLVLPWLAACVNDNATYQVDSSGDHLVTLLREQPHFWDGKLELSLIVARMPDCMRRHSLGTGTEKTRIELYQVPSGAFIVKLGKRLFVTETRTCVNFARLDAEPDGGLGQKLGTFRVQQGKLAFVREAGESAAEAE